MKKGQTRKKRRGAGGQFTPKITPEAGARIAELAREGQTQEAIAITLEQEGFAKVSHRTVGRYLEGVEERGGQISRRRRNDPRKSVVQTSAGASSDAPLSPPAPLDEGLPVGGLEWLQQQLSRNQAMLDKAAKDMNGAMYDRHLRSGIELAKQIDALKPPPPPDPEQDPLYVKARQRLMVKVRHLVEQHEAAPA